MYLIMKNYFFKKILLFLFIISMIPLYQASATQSDMEMDILKLYYKEEDLVITPTRHPKDILQVAENITVITSEELEMTNAHTLTDALNNIPGVQIDVLCGPGSIINTHIQGSDQRHLLVMIDGVALNNLSDNVADIGAIPIQNIDRVEIIKGPASSSWGSSLGGIIHIITKSPGESEGITGEYSAFYGEKNTTDFRAEASGIVRSVGYYFSAGNLYSDGLTQGTPYDEDNFYTKLNWSIADKGSLLFTLGYNKGSRGILKSPLYDLDQDNTFKYLFSALTLAHSINNETDFQLSFRSSSKNFDTINQQISTGFASHSIADDSSYGGSIDLTWRYGIHNIVLGYDFDKGKLESENIMDSKQYLKKWAVFSNNTIMIDKISLTPGIRYDYTNTNGDHVSPSLGLTYRMTERNLFRGYIARGFHIPSLSNTFYTGPKPYEANPDLKVEKIWSIQAGIESTALRYLWFKSTLFHHNIWDAIDGTLPTYDPNSGLLINKGKFINKKRQKRQGIEVEIKTVPIVYDTSLFAGFSFIDARDKDTGEKLDAVPKFTYDIGFKYLNKKSLWINLKGHYIYWNPSEDNTQDLNFIWDINIIKSIQWHNKITVKTFFTIHNIFNGSQYLSDIYKNHKRWIEAGLKYKF